MEDITKLSISINDLENRIDYISNIANKIDSKEYLKEVNKLLKAMKNELTCLKKVIDDYNNSIKTKEVYKK